MLMFPTFKCTHQTTLQYLSLSKSSGKLEIETKVYAIKLLQVTPNMSQISVMYIYQFASKTTPIINSCMIYSQIYFQEFRCIHKTGSTN